MTVPLSPSQHDSLAVDDGCSSVRVAVRARPLVEKELVENCSECVSYSECGKQVIIGAERRFTFDHVFGAATSQEDVYTNCVKPLVESCCAGYNATVLAYGQTGSGKTFTMGCGNNESLLKEDLGILPRAIRQLYECVEERSNQAEFLIKCAYVEIYNEEIKDLLHPDTPSKSISIREDAKGDIVLAGVKEEVVTNFENMIRLLEHGSMFRTTGSTLMNQHSSRSHAIFTIIVEQRSILDSASNEVITAKFHLVDLAGSERVKRTGAVGMRFKESVTINCGLLALGNVISALGDERKRCQHVPYRESKLTRMLQDSLGGNSRTCMIACISTADTNFEETLNTLKYANRARNIRNKPVINRDTQSILLNHLRQEIRALQLELLNSRIRNAGLDLASGPQDLFLTRADTSMEVTAELNTLRLKSRDSEHECLKLKDDIQGLQSLVNNLQEEMLILRTERNHYQLKLDEVNSELAALMQELPRWEGVMDISPMVKDHLLIRMKRAMGETDNEGPGFESSGSSLSSLDRPASSDAATRSERNPSFPTVRETARESSNSWPSSQPKEDHSVALMPEMVYTPFTADAKGANCNSPDRTSGSNRNIINQNLRTIRDLEERLALKESDVKFKEETLKEATEDLARDERIFAEKMKEIKTLKKLARDLTNERETLMQKAEKNSAMISQMSVEALAKEDELARLRMSIEILQSGRPDAFNINSACVPGVPVEVAKPKGENCDVHVDRIESPDEVKCNAMDNTSDAVDTAAEAPVEDLSEKLKVKEEEERLLSPRKAFEEQQHFEEDVCTQSRELRRSKQKGNFLTKCLMGL